MAIMKKTGKIFVRCLLLLIVLAVFHRHVLSGYKGDERFIDMTVYNGAAEEFRKQFG